MAISGLYVTVVSRMDIPEAKGIFGHSIGVLGSILMVMTETLYSLRKRAIHRPWGRLSAWLRFHIFTGIVGPFLLLLHTAWSFRGLAGVVMLMTIMVMLSGFFGRYIYTAIPRTSEGVVIEIKELETRVKNAQRELQEMVDDDETIFDGEIDTLKDGVGLVLNRGPRFIVRRIKWWLSIRALEPEDRLQAQRTESIVSRVRELERQKASFSIARRLLSTWHTVHVPLGMILFTAALFHIGAALYYATLIK
jgi:hypothetical protein